MLVDMLVLPMSNFDVVLNMTWLICYGVTIDCQGANLSFVIGERSAGSKLIWQRPQFLTTMELWEKLMMAALSVEEKELSVGIVLVVQDFVEVFPKDLIGLSPEREVEFEIDVMPRTNPISKDPYRMATVEMQELSVQVDELLKKGFIRPSVSPWGALVLFVKKKEGSLRLCIDY